MTFPIGYPDLHPDVRRLAKLGFGGKIHCSEATSGPYRILLPDSGRTTASPRPRTLPMLDHAAHDKEPALLAGPPGIDTCQQSRHAVRHVDANPSAAAIAQEVA